jgi:hypothetical protein
VGSTTGNATVTTSTSGVAAAPSLFGNGKKGTFTVIASVAGLLSEGVFDLTID